MELTKANSMFCKEGKLMTAFGKIKTGVLIY